MDCSHIVIIWVNKQSLVDYQERRMALTANTVDHHTLAHLVEAGAVRTANIVGQPGGWAVVVQYGTTERALAAKRGRCAFSENSRRWPAISKQWD